MCWSILDNFIHFSHKQKNYRLAFKNESDSENFSRIEYIPSDSYTSWAQAANFIRQYPVINPVYIRKLTEPQDHDPTEILHAKSCKFIVYYEHKKLKFIKEWWTLVRWQSFEAFSVYAAAAGNFQIFSIKIQILVS